MTLARYSKSFLRKTYASCYRNYTLATKGLPWSLLQLGKPFLAMIVFRKFGKDQRWVDNHKVSYEKLIIIVIKPTLWSSCLSCRNLFLNAWPVQVFTKLLTENLSLRGKVYPIVSLTKIDILQQGYNKDNYFVSFSWAVLRISH